MLGRATLVGNPKAARGATVSGHEAVSFIHLDNTAGECSLRISDYGHFIRLNKGHEAKKHSCVFIPTNDDADINAMRQ